MSSVPEQAGQAPVDWPAYDVFLSHNSRDKPAVQRIFTHLRSLGLRPWLDDRALEDEWHGAMQAAIDEVAACVVSLGPNGWGRWQLREAQLADSRHIEDPAFRVIPVLLPGLTDDALHGLPRWLGQYRFIDFRDGLDDPDRLQELRNRILGISADAAAPDAHLDEVACPYRGLEAFGAEHARYFYGRDADVDRLISKVKASRFLAVLGASGSGKSSVVLAGLLPKLQSGALPGSETWKVQILRPGGDPLKALADAATLLSAHQSVNKTLDELAVDARTLDGVSGLILAEDQSAQRVLWVVDQAEELFTQCHDAPKRAQFLANLVHVSTAEGGRAMVVLTMRADFYANCAEYPEFARLLESNQYLVGPLDEDGLRRAIVEPAGDLGRTLETGLVETILDDVRQQPGGLPLLQYALRELWLRQEGRVLTLRGYREAGGVAGALAKRADAVIQGLSDEEHRVARSTLLQLTQPQEGMDATRRRATLRQLVPSEALRPVVEQVVQQLVAARLLTTDRQANDEWVDVAHESLIRNWETLHQWVEEDREGLRLLHKLQDATEEWRAHGHADEEVWAGARLAQALEWQPQHEDMLSDDVRAFLDAGVARRDRQERLDRARVEERLQDARRISRANRLLRAWLAAAVVIGVVAIAATVFALQQRSTADANATQADQQRQGRVTELLAAEALDRLDQRDLSLLLSVEASRRLGGDSPAVKRSLLTGLTQSDGLSRFLYGPADARTDWVGSVAFSPDGKLLVSGADSGALMFWDSASGTLLGAPIVGQSGRVWSVAFSPDGQTVASGSDDHTIRLWDVATRQPRGEPLQGHTAAVRSVAFSPDGGLLASSADDGTVRVWDGATGQPHGAPLLGHVGGVRAVAFSPDGALLASGGNDGTIRLWDPLTGLPQGQPLGGATISPLNNEVASLAFSPNPADGLLAAGNWNGTVALWDVRTGQTRGPPKKISSLPVESIAFGPSGRVLVTGNSDKTMTLWNIAGTAAPQSYTGQGASVTSVAVNPQSLMVASAGQDGSIVLWDRPDDQPLYRGIANKHTVPVGALAFDATGGSLIAATGGGTTSVWDLATRTSHAPPTPGFPTPLLSTALDPRGGLVAMESGEGSLTVSDVSTQRVVARLDIGDYTPANLAFSPNGQVLGSVGCGTRTCDAGQIRMWNVSDWQPHGQPISVPDQPVRLLAFSPDARTLATISATSALTLWDTDTATRQAEPVVVSDSTVNALAFSPDGRTLAAGDSAGNVNLYDVTTKQVSQLPLTGNPSWIASLAFSPDGRSLATGSLFGAVVEWDLADGQPTSATLSGGDGTQVLSLVFSADGRMLASGSQNGFIWTWDTLNHQSVGDPLFESGAGVSALSYTPDGQDLGVGTTGGMLEVWDMVSGSLVKMAPILGTLTDHAAFGPNAGSHTLAVTSDAGLGFWDFSSPNAPWPTWHAANPKGGGLAFDKSGQTLAVAGCSQWQTTTQCGQGAVQLWDVGTQQPRGDPLVAGPVLIESVAMSPDGSRVAGGAPDGTIFVWDTRTNQLVGPPLKGHTLDVSSLAFSPDGSILASGSRDTNIVLWNAVTGQPIGQPLRGHSNSVYALAFSPDGRVLASGGADASVRLWDVSSGAPIGTLDNGAWVTSVAFKPDDPNTLVSAGVDGDIWVWDVSMKTWQQRACLIAGRDLTMAEWHQYVGDEPYRATCSTLAAGG